MRNVVTWLLSGIMAVTVMATPAPDRSGVPARPVRAVVVNATVLGFGDSITYGTGSTDGAGYRKHVDAQIRGWTTPWVHTWVGPFTDPTGRRHGGRGGWRIDQLITVARADVTAARSGIVLAMAGTNDARADHTAAVMLADMARLLAEVKAAAPGAFVVVARIPRLPSGTATQQAQVAAYNAGLTAVVATAVAAGQWVVLADMSGIHVGSDGVHPDDQGYAQEAAEWLKAIRPVLP